MVFSLLPAGVFADTSTVVTIFTTNDIHGIVGASETAIGLAQAAAMKASTANSLLVDAGDAVQGASFATISQGLDVIEMMNAAGYDVMAAGNHEFDYGTEQLLKLKEAADFPILSANVKKDGSSLLESNTIIEVGGKKIGFVGITTTKTATSTNPAKLSGVSFGDEITAVKDQIAALKDNTDAIILVCHLGNNETAVPATSEQLLDILSDDELKEVAAVIDGHSHTVEQDTYTRDSINIPIVQTGTQFVNIGMVEITFNGDDVSATCKVLNKAAAAEYKLTADGTTKKADVEKALSDIQSKQKDVLGQELCENDTPLWGGYIYYDYVESRIVETPYGDFVTDAFAAYAKEFAEQNGYDIPVIAVENGGGIGQTLPAGTVTRGDVLNAFNHGNMVEVYQVTPQMLRTALEDGLKFMTGQDETGLLLREKVSGSFLQVSGFSYTYDPAGTKGAKVVDITLADGTKLDLSDNLTMLLLATNNYVGTFAGISEGEKDGELGGEDQIVMEYILSCTKDGSLSYDSGEPRIKIANDKSPDTYKVEIPVTFSDGTPAAKSEFTISIDGGKNTKVTTNADGKIVLTLEKGAHTISLKEAMNQDIPVYVNNYSGSGTVTTTDGYYHLGFAGINIDDYKAEIKEKIEKYAQRNIDDINEYFNYSDKEMIQKCIDVTKGLKDIALAEIENVVTYDEADELYNEFKDRAELVYEILYFNEEYEFYKAGVKENADGALSENDIADICEKLDNAYNEAVENLQKIEAGNVKAARDTVKAGVDAIDAIMVDANKIVVKSYVEKQKEYYSTKIGNNAIWFSNYDKTEEALKSICDELDALLKDVEAATDIEKQNEIYEADVLKVYELWAALNAACGKGMVAGTADDANRYASLAQETDGKDRSAVKAAAEAIKAEAEKAIDAIKAEDFEGDVAANDIFNAFVDIVDKYQGEIEAEYLEAWLVACEEIYTDDIENFSYLTDEEKAEGVKDVKEAIKAVRDEIAGKSKEEIAENSETYKGVVNLAYAKAYLPDLERNATEFAELLDYVSDSDKAAFLKLLDENIKAAEKIISDKNAAEWRAVDELIYEVEDALNELWLKDTLLWTEKYALEEYDELVNEYQDKLDQITQEEFDSTRELLKSASEDAAKKVRDKIDDYNSIDDICEELQNLFDNTSKGLFEANAQRRINAVADDVKAAIKALEKKNGVDLSEYLSSVDNLSREALAVLTADGEFGFTSNLNAVSAAYDELEKTAADYEAKIRAILTEAGAVDVPDTGVDMTIVVVFIVLSGCLAAVLAKKKLRR